MTLPATESTTEMTVRRIAVQTPLAFGSLTARFEAAVPALDLDGLHQLAARGATWDEIQRAAGHEAAYELYRFWTHSPSALLHLAGNDAPSRIYLIGSLALSARLFRIEPGTALHAPLRIELHAHRAGGTVMSFDQPGSQLGSYGPNKIRQAGYELDRLLGDLLEGLDLPRPTALRR